MIDISDKPKGAFWRTMEELTTGEGLIYARGLVCNGPHKADAADAYRWGIATLVQRRNGTDDYSYIAQKLDPKRRKI